MIIDIISKRIVISFIELGRSVIVIPSFFSLTYVRNDGVAFSLLSGRVSAIILFSIIVIGIIYYFLKKGVSSKLEGICYSMVLGGALGNLLDRIIYGYVIDFFDFTLFGYSFAIFNVADILIVVGVFMLVILEFRKGGK